MPESTIAHVAPRTRYQQQAAVLTRSPSIVTIRASHVPVSVGNLGLDCGEPGNLCVVGREVAHRVRCGGEREGLAPTTAEIELAARAACARLLHPCGAAEDIEGRGI